MIPDHTTFKDHLITAKGDVVIGDRSLVQFGINTDGRVFIGEHVITSGNISATNDIRIDIFSNIGGDLLSGRNVYLGEKVKVRGKLSLDGDLDVGDDVNIENGFEAKGWINIRSPVPVVIYIFIYLLQLLKLGHSEEIDRILEELEQNDGETIPISESFLFVPNNSIIGLTKSKIDCNLHVGRQCTILGNYEIKGNIFVEPESNVCGSLSATKNVFCGKKVKIQGNISSDGEVHICEGATVGGDVSGEKILLAKTAAVQGTLIAKEGVTFVDASQEEATEKVKRFENDADIVDEMKGMLE